jgi:hypothetical protein
MIVFIPAVTASGLWLWKQAAVRRWLRARAIRRERLPSEASAPTAKMFTPGSTDSSDRFPDWRST